MQTECRQDTGPFFPLLFSILIGSAFLSVAHAEDWTTTDGKTYKNIKVVKVEVDAVTILDEDGGARIPLASLPPDLQKRFNYDPEAAKREVDAQKEEENKEIVLRSNKYHAYGIILQVVPGGLIQKEARVIEAHNYFERHYISNYVGEVFVSCNATGLSQDEIWEGTVWKIGTYSYTSSVGAVDIPKYTTNPNEAYAALNAPVSHNTVTDITPIRDREEWRKRLADLSSILIKVKTDGGTFKTTQGVVYYWKDITDINPVRLSYMTDTNVGNIPFKLLPVDVAQKLGLTLDEFNKWSLEETQLKMAIDQNQRNILDSKDAIAAQEVALAQFNQNGSDDATDREKAKEMAINITQNFADKVQALSDELQDMQKEIDKEQAQLWSERGQDSIDIRIAESNFKTLEAQYDDKKGRYDQAKSDYDNALLSAEFKYYQQMRLEESKNIESQKDAAMRQIAPPVIPADSATNTAPAQTKDADVTTPPSP